MLLTIYTLKNINPEKVSLPDEQIFELPEKVLQFGTGVLLRGLPDYFIDKANKQGIFNGRIVVVKSTSQGDTSAFDKQDGLYTICVRGLENGQTVEENIVNASISRVLTATEQWQEILACAQDPNMKIVISNTTEVGITLLNEDIRKTPPQSFPGKLLAFLYERYRAFNGAPDSGMVIVPTELITDNGRKLEAIIFELAHLNSLDDKFIEWLEQSNYFCNTLVDRIVPGKPDAANLKALEEDLGFSDGLLTMSEVYRLWAIEGGAEVKQVLSFAAADEGVVIAEDINIYRELKLRLLNGTHTLSCGLAYLAGFNTVKEAMDDANFSSYLSGLMLNEIAPAIPYDVDLAQAREFGGKVVDRFRNPEIKHQWISITMNYSSKMRMRNLPVLKQHFQNTDQVPPHIALGFAAYLLFMRATVRKDEQYFGERNGESYLIQDDQAAVFYRRWAGLSVPSLVKETLSDAGYWGEDLSAYPGFAEAVTQQLNLLMQNGATEALEQVRTKTTVEA